jgi:hypothetical protein
VTWDFNHELARAYDWFQTDTRSIAGDRWDAFADKVDAWLEQSHEPKLFHEWYIASDDGELRRFDLETSRLVPVPWPANLVQLRGVHAHVPELEDPPALVVPLLPHGLGRLRASRGVRLHPPLPTPHRRTWRQSPRWLCRPSRRW